jgi:CCR4-NOT transcriptional regulation complex NOT5 subunit
MRGRKKENLDTLTFEERIGNHFTEIEKLKDLIKLRNYFEIVKDKRSLYIVEMRKNVAEDLLKQGYTFKEIGRVLGRDHSSIHNLMKIQTRKDVKEAVSENYKQWIGDKVYPVSQQQEIYCAESKTGRTTRVSYDLAKTKEEIERINSTKLWLKKEKRFYGNTDN